MDIIKFKPKKSYIRVLFKDKVFLMLRRCQMNDKWERRSVLWKGMQVTKNEHTIIGTPVITFSKPCSLYTQQYRQRENILYAIHSYRITHQNRILLNKGFMKWKELFYFCGNGQQNAFLNTHFWILLKCQFVCLHT